MLVPPAALRQPPSTVQCCSQAAAGGQQRVWLAAGSDAPARALNGTKSFSPEYPGAAGSSVMTSGGVWE